MKLASSVVLGLVSLAASVFSARAEVKMPAIFGDHMVLQQGMKLPVWGRANPGEKVTVSVGGSTAEAVTDSQGNWQVKLDSLPLSNQPVEMTVSGENRLVFQDVLIGDTWLCSGQSNMEFGMGMAHNAAEAIPKASNPQIRLFLVERHLAFEPQSDCRGKWVKCSPESIKQGGWSGFSAVAYFFGLKIWEDKKYPIGLIEAAWGGTPGAAWISLPALQADVNLTEAVNRFVTAQSTLEDLKEKYTAETLPKYEAALQAWKTDYGKSYFASNQYQQWLRDSEQARATSRPVPPMPRPAQPWPEKPQAPDENPKLPTVLFNGMIHPLIPYGIKGVIWYQGEADGMSKPTAKKYAALFPALISDWRAQWEQGDFPFLYVQLAGHYKQLPQFTAGADFPILRDAQLKTLSLPNTGMAVAIDIGEKEDIHPRNKQEVGNRLAMVARHVAYGEDVVYSGPIYKSMTVEGDKIRLSFDNIGGGLTIRSAPALSLNQAQTPPVDHLQAFEIAGANGKFVPAQAQIDGATIVVWSPQVPNPEEVRYAWAGYPEPMSNLYNKEGLPASPFTTSTSP